VNEDRTQDKARQTLESLPDVLTIPEVARVLRIGRNTAYEAVRRNEIPAIPIGRRLVVPKQALCQLLSGQAA